MYATARPTARRGSGAERWFPALQWLRGYGASTLTADLLAALIVTVMLIPQSLAYALLAGLPPEVGLYASILPLAAYAVFGTSRTLSVGPVAVVSLLTASALAQAGLAPEERIVGALILALLSGLMLLGLGLLRLGWLANLLSHPVISGFITASGVLIAAGQLRHILGTSGGGATLPEIVEGLIPAVPETNPSTLVLGTAALAGLWWMRSGLAPLLRRFGVPSYPAQMAARAGPMIVVAASVLAVWLLRLDQNGVRIVGEIPSGLPPLTLPRFDAELWLALAVPAALISLIGFVESVSVGQTLAAKRRQSIDPDQELIGLGASNLAAAFSGGYPVTGGFSRSVVNFDAGAETPAAGAMTAVGIAAASLLLTPLIHYLPIATLAATIIVAVLSLIDLHALRRSWRYSKADFAAMAATVLGTLAYGVEAGVLLGVTLSILLHLWRTTRPHAAVVGQVPGTEHYRNVDRHDVITSPRVLSIRVDESLYFANARAIESLVQDQIANRPQVEHVVLQCSAVNFIDGSALESLELLVSRLRDAGITFHLSEVKGPVMDRLSRTDFMSCLTGKVFLSHHEALAELAPEITRGADARSRPALDAGSPFPERRPSGRLDEHAPTTRNDRARAHVDWSCPAAPARCPRSLTMSYTINRTISDAGFDDVVERTRAALADQGFGVLTEIDAKATMKKKLDVDMEPYLILGACNPKMAHQAIGMEPRVGAMLPCNVILRQAGDGVEVSAIDPVESMAAIENDELKSVAGQVRDMLAKVVERI